MLIKVYSLTIIPLIKFDHMHNTCTSTRHILCKTIGNYPKTIKSINRRQIIQLNEMKCNLFIDLIPFAAVQVRPKKGIGSGGDSEDRPFLLGVWNTRPSTMLRCVYFLPSVEGRYLQSTKSVNRRQFQVLSSQTRLLPGTLG